ncbi:SNF2 family N-terminal domain-domain-containing protein [Phakopsora pachyrhizi]|uniref:SNF2 family N-terminal domain-domain-containing protein n=1 Tax=Phakopsora pachyrhizi TaxID=170000 RepID=A0AAV0B5M6_PHAPC|nr:SNF2 family N-terminal domain-domain-containing protein [Phakopsora pachyrhizi]
MELPVLEGGVERDRPEEEDLKKGNHKKSENIDEQQLFNIDPDLDQHQGLSTSNRIDPLVILTSVTDGSDIITDRNQMLHYQSSNQQQEKQPASSATQESPPLPQPEQSSPSLSSSSSYAPSSLSDPSRLIKSSSNPISSNPKFRHLPSNQLLALRQNVALRQAEQLQHHHDQKPSNPLQCGPSLSSTNSMAMAFNTSPYNQTLISMPPPSSAPSSSRVHLPPPHPADLYQSFPISHTPRSIYPSQSPWRSNYLLQPTPYAHDCSSTSTIHDEIPLCIGLLSSSVFILYPIKNLDPPGFGPDSQARAQTLPVLISRGQPNASQEMLKVISASNGEPLGLVDYKMANVIGPLLGPYNSISGTNPVGGWKPQLNGVSRGDNNGYTDEDVDDDIEIEEIDGVTGQTINRKPPSQPQSDGRRLYIECCVIRRGEVDPMMLPLQFLVFCLPSNVQLFGSYLARSGIVLEHPISYEPSLHLGCQYANPHRAHSGESWENARQRLIRSGSTFPQNTISLEPGNSQTKTYDAHEQVEAVFKNLASGVDLDETEPSELVVTPLYPHQKQALSFMLDRERLKDVEETKETVSGPVELAKLELEDEVNLVSLWKKNRDSRGKHIGWINVVTGTQQNCTQSPEQCRGSLLADDMGLGKTISVISLIATTLSEALEFSFSDVVKPAVVTQTTVKNALASDKSKKLTDHASTLLERLGHLSGGDTLSASHAKLKKDDQAAAKKQSAVDSRFKMVKVKSRATLIVSPLSTIQNWESQIEEHVRRRCGIDSKDLIDGSNSRSALSVYVYHGNQRNPDPEFLADHDIVITTYSLMGYEFARQNRNNKVEEDNHDSSDGIEEIDSKGNPLSSDAGRDRNKAQAKRKRKGDGLPSPLQAVQWFRIVLDEAHMIKEHTTIQAKAACDLLAERRVCLTGTPLQNSLNDLFSLVCFLRLEPFTDRSLWTAYVGTPAKMGNRLGVTRLHLIMRHLALRRTKQTVDKFGKPILSLPHKKNDIVYLDFDDSEKEFYLAYHQQSRKTFLTMEKSQTVLKNYCSILQEILRLRQICTHIGLVVDAEKKAGKSAYDVLALADNQAKFDKTRAIQLLMILRDTGATQCSECGVDAIPVSNEEDLDEFEDYIPTTNKRGRKSNGTSAGKRKGKALGSSLANDSDSPTIVITRCQHLFCLKCFNYSSEVTCQVDCLVCSQKLSPLVDVYKATIAELDKSIRLEEMGAQNRLAPESNTEDRMSKAKKSNSGKAVNPASSSTSANHGKEKSTNSFDTMHLEHSTKIKHLIWDLLPFSRANPSSSNFSPNFTTFGNGLDGLGDDEEEPPEFRPTVGTVVKSVVFSQWTKLLDKISDALTEYKIEHVRLDGTMNREERSDSMSAFKIHPRFEVLLVSLRAGGVGLNLTCAQRVYLMEPFWNPAVENQAVDRVHRLGQTKPVRMIRYIISGSIEQNLLEIQKRKTELANMSLGQTLSKAELAKRRLEDLSILFRDNMKR